MIRRGAPAFENLQRPTNLGSLQRQKVVIESRTVTAYVCTDCIKSGRAIRPTR